MRLLGLRAHSVAELRRKLRARQFSEDIAETIVCDLTDCGLLDDKAFATAYCDYKLSSSRPVGYQKLEAELRKRGIDWQVIAQVMASVRDGEPTDAQYARALTAGEAKWKSVVPRCPEHTAAAKVVRYLAGRGFPADVRGRVIDTIRARISSGE